MACVQRCVAAAEAVCGNECGACRDRDVEGCSEVIQIDVDVVVGEDELRRCGTT